MKLFEVWRQGYCMTGVEGIPEKAEKLGEAEAENFIDACKLVMGDKFEMENGRPITWCCYLFDNEADARKAFG